MKLLVHACCGPCSIMPARLLADAGHDITVLYANSNIAPRAEYEKRLAELQKYADSHGFGVIEAPYDPEEWERTVAPIGEAALAANPNAVWLGARHAGVDDADGRPSPQSVAELLDDENRQERCRACYRMRLEEAARYAAGNGFEGLSTTLAVSPYQFTGIIHEELERAANAAGVQAVFEDFRPYYDEATRISRELGMYRQNYCGCRFSIAEGQATRAFIKQQRTRQKAERAAARAEEEAVREQQRAEKRAYEEKQARKRAILKQMREQEKQHEDE